MRNIEHSPAFGQPPIDWRCRAHRLLRAGFGPVTGMLLFVAGLLAGCGSTYLDRPLRFDGGDWRQEGFDGRKSRSTSFEMLEAPLDTLLLMDADGPMHAASPLAGDGVFIVPLRSGGIEVFDAASGEDVGFFDVKGYVMGTPAVLGNRMYIPTTGETSALQCRDMNSGELLWSRPTASLETAVAVSDESIVTASYDGHVYCFTPADSVEQWDVKPGGNIYAAPTIAGGVVLAATSEGDVFALDLRSGELRWRVPMLAPIFASPVVVSQRSYIISQAGVLRCLQQSDGAELWSHDFKIPAYASPACDGDQLFVALSDGSLAALDARDGKEMWRYRFNGIVSAAPLVTANAVFAASLEGQLALVDKHSGELLWSASVQGRIYTAPTLYRGKILIANEWGDLMVFHTAEFNGETK